MGYIPRLYGLPRAAGWKPYNLFHGLADVLPWLDLCSTGSTRRLVAAGEDPDGLQ